MEDLAFWLPVGGAFAATAGYIIHGLLNGPWWGP
jgi:hypothetical protein